MHLGQLYNHWQTQIDAILGVGISLHSAHFIQWGHWFGRYNWLKSNMYPNVHDLFWGLLTGLYSSKWFHAMLHVSPKLSPLSWLCVLDSKYARQLNTIPQPCHAEGKNALQTFRKNHRRIHHQVLWVLTLPGTSNNSYELNQQVRCPHMSNQPYISYPSKRSTIRLQSLRL